MQQVFAQLGYDQQIALYKQAALQALQAYDLLGESVHLEPVTFVNHATFKVIVSTFGRSIRQFALHIYRPGVRDAAHMTAELRWLVALHAETTLETPPPVATTTGTLLNTVILPQCSEPLYCVLFESTYATGSTFWLVRPRSAATCQRPKSAATYSSIH